MKIKDWSGVLIFATVVITVVRYMGAFAIADVGQINGIWSEIMSVFLTISGLGMGILDVLGGGLLFNGWRITMPRSGQKWTPRFWVLTICVFGLILSGIVILVPFTVSRMESITIVEALGGKTSALNWVWATMVVSVPYFLIAGVFVGNKMVEGLESDQQVSSNLPKRQKEPEQVTQVLPVNWKVARRSMNEEDVKFFAYSTPKEIVVALRKKNIIMEPRTASNWRKYARIEMGLLIEDEEGE